MEGPYWEVTRNTLQSDSNPLFKKPRLTEALLRRPPFRFLHDIVTAVQKRTGFAAELFTEEESDAKALAEDREGKIVYLNKLIRAVEDASGEALDADPYKIVAGLEPERTNILLQTLGRVALTTGVDNRELRRPPSRRGTADPCVAQTHQPTTETEGAALVEILKLDESDAEEGPSSELRPASGTATRPQTATKALPSARYTRLETPRRPPSRGGTSRPGSRHGARLLPPQPPSSDSDVEVETSRSTFQAEPTTVEGALVRDLRQEAVSTASETPEPGIVLPRRRGQANSAAPVDLESLKATLSGCHPLAATLLSCLENLIEAVEPMQREHDYWKSEAERIRERLHESAIAATPSPDRTPASELLNSVAEQRTKLRSLKDAAQRHANTIDAMLRRLTQ